MAILYGLAMLLPLAHVRMSSVFAGDPTIAQAYPDGSLPVLCLTGKSGQQKSVDAAGCAACALSAAPGLATPDANCLHFLALLRDESLLPEDASATLDQANWPPSQPRAPLTI